jgi:outer membrane protein
MKNRTLFFSIFFSAISFCNAQNQPLHFTLQEVIQLANAQSPQAKIAKTTLENKYWQFKTYKSNYLPQLSLNGTLPDFNKSNNAITQPDGSIVFRNQSFSTASLEMSLSQNIGPTGGQIFASSYLQRLDALSTPTNVSYLSNPILIGFRQPLFRFNQLKWDARIEPLLYEESKRQYAEDLEAVSVLASERFFNLLIAEISVRIETLNLANNDTLFQIAKGRYNLGRIAENELLQMELSTMNARSNLAQAQLDRETHELRLRNFLNIKGQQSITLVEPPLIPNFVVDDSIALMQARQNRQAVIEFERRRIEADRDVAQARGNNGFNADLVATYGLTNTAANLSDVYINSLEQERINLTFQLPILDWGRTRSQVRTAQVSRELTRTILEQDQQNFEQEVVLLAKQFAMQREKLIIATRADTIAQKRYEISMKRYLIGKIDITDLNIALQEKDNAKVQYLAALQQFWGSYFDLRRKTLFDFENNKPINN